MSTEWYCPSCGPRSIADIHTRKRFTSPYSACDECNGAVYKRAPHFVTAMQEEIITLRRRDTEMLAIMDDAESVMVKQREEIAALKAELARKPVCVGYIDEADLRILRKNDYLQYPEVSIDKGGDYQHPIYIDPPEREIAQQGEEG